MEVLGGNLGRGFVGFRVKLGGVGSALRSDGGCHYKDKTRINAIPQDSLRLKMCRSPEELVLTEESTQPFDLIELSEIRPNELIGIWA